MPRTAARGSDRSSSARSTPAWYFRARHRRNENDNARLQSAVRCNDVKILFRAQIETETRLGDNVIGEAERQVGADDAVRSLGDGWRRARRGRWPGHSPWSGPDSGGGVFQKGRDSPSTFRSPAITGRLSWVKPTRILADLSSIPHRPGEAQNGHDLAGGTMSKPVSRGRH